MSGATRGLDQTRPQARVTLDRAWVSPDHRWTLGDAVGRWLTGRHGWSPLTIARYQRSLQRFMDDMGGSDVHLDVITPIDFHEWVADLKPTRTWGPKDYSPAALNTTVAPVRAFFGWATQLQLVASNPTLETAPSKVGKRPPKRLTREACAAVLAASDPRERVQLTLIFTYGIRLGELARLRVEDWDRGNDSLTILGKGNKVRILPVVGEAKAELTGWVDFVLRRTSGPMWPSTAPGKAGQGMTAGWIGRRISAMGERVGVHLYPHKGRHTALSDMLEEGIDMQAVRAVAGHESLATLGIYASSSPEHLRRAMGERRRPYADQPAPEGTG